MLFSSLFAEAMLPPVTPMMAQTLPVVFEKAPRTTPLEIRSLEEAKAVFSEGGLASLRDQMNFDQQYLVVMAWRGSGQDRMELQIAESFPEQVTFVFSPGRTRDLRSHVKVYALRNKVTWTSGR